MGERADQAAAAGDRPQASLRRHLLLALLVWNPLIVAAFGVVLGTPAALSRTLPMSLSIATIVTLVCFGAVIAIRAVEEAAARRWGRPPAEHGRAWYFVQALAAMPVGLYLAFAVVHRLFEVNPPDLRDYRVGIAFGSIICGGFFLWQARAEARDAARLAELRAAGAQKLELEAHLAALTAQMNPHLLFNALNTVASLIASDPERAEEVVVRLADLYRGVLAATRRPTHALADEVGLCRAYLDVEQARFGDRLRVTIDLPADPALLARPIPVLSLQPLVENAVTHGLADRASGGEVVLRAVTRDGALELTVEDDGVGLGNSPRAGAGVGLETTRRRLRASHGERASVTLSSRAGGGTVARLRLPLDGPEGDGR